MALGTYVTAVLLGAATTGFWLVLRLRSLTPRSPGGAARLFACGLGVLVLGRPLLSLALPRMPAAQAVLIVVFPLLVCSFASTAAVLRYLVRMAASRAQ